MRLMKTDVVEPVVAELVRAIDLADGPAAVARALNVTTQTVCFWRDGRRRMGSEHGAALEQAAGFKVTRQQMWPVSWQRIWPELATDAVNEPRSTELASNHGG
jgi:DNA-binding transcriptional regulator YdaS (Cro superfamily)